MDIHFLKCLELISLSLAKELCVCYGESLKLSISLHFLLPQSLKVSPKWETGTFSVLPRHNYKLVHAHSFLNTQEYEGIFQSILWTSHSTFFFSLLSALPTFWWPQLLLSPQAATRFNNACWLFFVLVWFF